MTQRGRMVVGRRRNSKVWHAVRKPDYRHESWGGELGPADWLLSTCNHIWMVQQITFGEVTCRHCLKRLKREPL